MSISELPMPPTSWWLLVLTIVALFIFLGKKILDDLEREYVPSSEEEKLKTKITESKFLEAIAWLFAPLGLLIYVYGILSSGPFTIFIVASCLIVASYLVATRYRRKRFSYQEELKEKQQL